MSIFDTQKQKGWQIMWLQRVGGAGDYQASQNGSSLYYVGEPLQQTVSISRVANERQSILELDANLTEATI